MTEEEIVEPSVPAVELERLLGLMAKGDTGALADFYTRTHGAVYALALSMTGSAQDAQELAHDAYLRIWDYAGSYRAKGSPMAWTLAIARNLCLMELRRRKRRADLTDEEWNAIPADAPGVSAEDRAVLQRALSILEPNERQIVLLHAVSGLKHREIARLVDLPLNTVLSKYRRAIAKLRAMMEEGE